MYVRPEDWHAQLLTNTLGPINVTRAFLPYMRAARSGTVVWMGSAAATCGMETLGLYCASKWALTGTFAFLNVT
jgi:NAD(P)-dependent dehydrogenase (short-subunit alcohol dehydrogenase family)